MKLLLPLIYCGISSLLTVTSANAADEPVVTELSVRKPFTLTTLSGKVYDKARVLSTEPDGIRIMHADGAAKIPFSELTTSQRKEFGYDVDKESAYNLEQAKLAGERKAAEARFDKMRQDEEDLSTFRATHSSILSSISRMDYDFAKLDSSIMEQIVRYRADGKKDWARTLEVDRETLKQREIQRPAWELAKQSREIEAQNKKLQEQIDQLRTQQKAAESMRRITYVPPIGTSSYFTTPTLQRTPLSYPNYSNSSGSINYYNYSYPYLYVRPAPSCGYTTPTLSRGVQAIQNGGGTVPSDLNGTFDTHGGYTPR